MSEWNGLLRMAELRESSLPEIIAELRRRDDIVAKGATKPKLEDDDDLTLFDARDVAVKIGIPVASVYELIRRKEIGCVRVSVGSRKGKKRRIKVSPAQVRAFIATNSEAAA